MDGKLTLDDSKPFRLSEGETVEYDLSDIKVPIIGLKLSMRVDGSLEVAIKTAKEY